MPSPRVLHVVLMCGALTAAVAGGVSAYRFTLDWLADWEAVLAPGLTPDYAIGPRDYLPSAALLAATTLLCTAVGTQLLPRRPWRSVLALGTITTAVLVCELTQAYVGLSPQLVVVSLWAGTAAVWCATRWRAHSTSPAASVAPGAAAVPLSAVPVADAAPPFPQADSPQPHSGQAVLVRSTRRLVTALVVAALVILGLLMVVSLLDGLQLYYLGWRPALDDLQYSAQALLAALAVWAAWLAGRSSAGPHRTTWLTAVLVGVILGAVEPLAYPTPGNLAVPVLVTCAVLVAALRECLADRAERLLSS